MEQAFPAPEFREHQKDSICKVVAGFEEYDKDVVLLDAPTGSGKSLILHTAAKALDGVKDSEGMEDDDILAFTVGDKREEIPQPLRAGTFFTTPLNALVDQLEEDEFISDHVVTLKGRNNYECIHPEDSGTPVNEAVCQREDNFECDVKHSCPYYGRKYDALQHPEVVTNMSYLMAEGMIPGTVEGTFGDRDLLIVDECQKLEDFAMNFISFTISKYTVPDEVWSNITIPHSMNQDWADDDEEVEENMDFLVKWLRTEVLDAVQRMIEYLDDMPTMNKSQSEDLENLQQFQMRVQNFLDDIENNDWIADIDRQVKKNKPNETKIVFKPIELGRFLEDLLWSRADNIILSSATIPRQGWLTEIGLGDADVGKVTVPSTFPVENRPIVLDEAVGKMTKDERRQTAPKMAEKIKQIAEYHDGKGMIHCRAYSIADLLKKSFFQNGDGQWFKENCMMQDQSEREQSLEDWQNSDKQVFFSVAMDEGVDLEGDKCRWQVMAKALFKSLADKRVRYRLLERNERKWYNRHAAIQIMQAYGRAVRGPEDEAVFYVLDTSAANLIKDNQDLFTDWFLEAIER